MRALEAFDSTIKRARALMKAHRKLRGKGRHKRPRFHSELRRAAVVTAVSAMDAYFRDKIVENVRKAIRRTNPQFPQELVEFLGENSKSEELVRTFLKISMRERPLAHVTTLVARRLNERAFQDPGKIERGLKLIGVTDFWGRIANRLDTTPKQAKDSILPYIRRRHEIVHSGDLYSAKNKKHQVRPISQDFANKCIEDIEDFVLKSDSAIGEAMAH